MKTLRLWVTMMLLGTLTLGMSQSNIDEQIEAIKNASSAKERVELMNRFKTTVTNLSQQQRQEAINQLRSSIQSTNSQTQASTRDAEKAQAQQRSRMEQMKNTQLLEQTQQMHQHQSANQALHEGIISPKNMQNGFMGKR